MINVTIDGTPPEKLERIKPQLSVNKDGSINWTPAYSDHNAAAFFRGKTLSPEEYNAALIKQIYQTNYLTDSISDFFNKQLSTVIYNNFINKFNLERSYIKTFFQEDWGEQHEDGYWYIDIPADVHGFKIASEDQDIYERMNIDANMYLLDHKGKFKEVSQVDVDTENTVRLFTDDNTLTGFVVVRTNDKAYALAEGYIQANQLTGLAAVATSGKFKDLVDIDDVDGPNTKIRANTTRIQQLIDGVDNAGNLIQVHKAHLSDRAESSDVTSRINSEGHINDVLVSEVFDGPASSIVKQAVKATDVDVINQNTNDDAEVRFKLGNGIGFSKTVNHVNHAHNATNATNDSAGQSIIDNYAKKDGTYPNMSVGSATKAVVESDGTISQLRRDIDDVLRNGDIVVPTKKILWKGDIVKETNYRDYWSPLITIDIPISEVLKVGDTIHILCNLWEGEVSSLATVNTQPQYYTFKYMGESRVNISGTAYSIFRQNTEAKKTVMETLYVGADIIVNSTTLTFTNFANLILNANTTSYYAKNKVRILEVAKIIE